MPNLFTSFMRTVVPLAVGLVLGLAADAGFDIDSTTTTAVVTTVLTAAYYTVFRLVEHAAAGVGVPWLTNAAGVLLGWAKPPQYPTR